MRGCAAAAVVARLRVLPRCLCVHLDFMLSVFWVPCLYRYCCPFAPLSLLLTSASEVCVVLCASVQPRVLAVSLSFVASYCLRVRVGRSRLICAPPSPLFPLPACLLVVQTDDVELTTKRVVSKREVQELMKEAGLTDVDLQGAAGKRPRVVHLCSVDYSFFNADDADVLMRQVEQYHTQLMSVTVATCVHWAALAAQKSPPEHALKSSWNLYKSSACPPRGPRAHVVSCSCVEGWGAWRGVVVAYSCVSHGRLPLLQVARCFPPPWTVGLRPRPAQTDFRLRFTRQRWTTARSC